MTELGLRAEKRARGKAAEAAFSSIAASAAAALLVVLAFMIYRLSAASAPAWRAHGASLISGSRWAPNLGIFGGLPFVYGTLISAAIAVIIGVPVAIATALFLSDMASARVRAFVAPIVDLLAAVPSVVFGLWGVFVLVPTLRPFEKWLASSLGSAIPFFKGEATGFGYLTAGIILAIMILPTVSAVSREVFVQVPREQREAALALGATRWEMIRTSVLPVSRNGIVGAVILGLGRALGETIAVTMVIGNSPKISGSILHSGYTLASVIANEFGEAASEDAHRQALIALALVLFGVTLIVNVLARVIIARKKVAR